MKSVIEILGSMKSSIQGAAENIPKNTDLQANGIQTILNWVYAFAGLVAVGFIVYGAINYALTQGDPGKVKQAGQTIAFAVIGLAVILLAAAITNFVASAA